MKFSNLLAAIVAASATTAYAGDECKREDQVVMWTYKIFVEDVDEIPSLCHNLWEQMKRWKDCTISAPTCESVPHTDGSDSLRWQFTVAKGCNAGMVGSSWWEATKNEFGAVTC